MNTIWLLLSFVKASEIIGVQPDSKV